MGVLATSTLHAQHVNFGVKAGLNASTYAGSDVPNPRFRLGPAAGLFVRLPLGQHLALQPELLYEQRGARTTSTQLFLGYDSPGILYRLRRTNRTHYVALPVLTRWHVRRFFALTGPQLSYLLGTWRRTETQVMLLGNTAGSFYDPAYPTSSTSTERGTGYYHRWELGYVVGLGYQVSSRLSAELRYAAGLTNLLQSQRGLTGYEFPQQPRNSTLEAQVSYQLGTL
ncbi:porin family protein [Hymenobacter crusticola]|uniref:porin family protein n=1 Tax=Hymenobacter crusticola TaxID=1770526 RepID=UPI0021CDD759|nr:porin family protein [Hymenobacter crusticola]